MIVIKASHGALDIIEGRRCRPQTATAEASEAMKASMRKHYKNT